MAHFVDKCFTSFPGPVKLTDGRIETRPGIFVPPDSAPVIQPAAVLAGGVEAHLRLPAGDSL